MSATEQSFSIYEFYRRLKVHHLSLVAQGIMSQDLLSLIALSIKRRPDNEVIARRLFALVVELAQNILHYSAVKEFSAKDQREVGVGIVAIGESDTHYLVASGNVAQPENAAYVARHCDYINQLDPDELREYYRQQRRLPVKEGSVGGSIGLIEIVRKSGQPLSYEIIPIEDDKVFLIFVAKVNKSLNPHVD
ncbi:MAG: SiaB family protein kinase [Cytophagales bacterium]|nr:SiaB family protein kinase [Bernardetiaceae bacterium]MDW8210798.1 SiaB family protein kinase [Cytophagales bacterium]